MRSQSLLSLREANYWMPSRTTMTSNGRQIHSKCVPRVRTPKRQMKSGTAEGLCREYIDIFSTSVRSLPAQVDPMVIEIDRTKWEVPRNRLPLDTILLKSKQPSARRSTNSWSSASSRILRSAIEAKLNAATKGLEGWPIPNILETLTRLGTMKPTCFGLLDFTAGYHQTPLDPASRILIAFRAAGGLYQWTRVAMGLKGCKVLNGLVYEICEI